MRFVTLPAILFCVTSLFFAGCGTDAPTDPQDLAVVVTANDPNFRFEGTTTYSMPDTVAIITDTQNPSANTPITITESFNAAIINEIAAQMQKAGYTRLTDTSGPKPALVLEVAAMGTTNTEVYYNYWYPTFGAYYGGWYGASFGVGCAPYASPYIVSSTVGSLILNLTNPNAPDPATQKIPTVWVGIVNTLLSGVASPDVQANVITGIDQAFAQSPYL